MNRKPHHDNPLDEIDNQSPIPAPEHGNHPLSPAAHLGGKGAEHTKPQGNLRHGSAPGELREPPQEIGRAGKQHR